jgi:hypothetical protein
MGEGPIISVPPSSTPTTTRERPYSFADVAMKVVQDGPAYMLILVACALALKGIATGTEVLMSAAMAFLSRSHPPHIRIPVVSGVMAALVIVAMSGLTAGCSAVRPVDICVDFPMRASDAGVDAKDQSRTIRDSGAEEMSYR